MATKKPVAVKRVRAIKPVGEALVWVLSERTKLFVWKPVRGYTTYDAANRAKESMEEASPYSLNGYKVDRVVMVV